MTAKLPATCKVIERPGERFRYWVESASEKGDAHTVDLSEKFDPRLASRLRRGINKMVILDPDATPYHDR